MAALLCNGDVRRRGAAIDELDHGADEVAMASEPQGEDRALAGGLRRNPRGEPAPMSRACGAISPPTHVHRSTGLVETPVATSLAGAVESLFALLRLPSALRRGEPRLVHPVRLGPFVVKIEERVIKIFFPAAAFEK